MRGVGGWVGLCLGLVICLVRLGGSSAQEPSNAAVGQDERERLERVLDDILATQRVILTRLDQVLREAEVVKVRATQN